MRKHLESKLPELEEKFRKLITIDEKFDFWLNEMTLPYYLLSESCLPQFYIITRTPEEHKYLNEKTFAQYLERRSFNPNFHSSLAAYARTLFYPKLEKFRNIKFIDEELGKIEITLKNYPHYKKNHQYFEIVNALNEAFNDAYFNGNYPDYSVFQFEFEFLKAKNDGFELAEYRKELEELRGIIENEEKNSRVTSTLNQQIIMLYYLGLLDLLEKDTRIVTKQNKALLLSSLLNQDAKNVKTLLERPDLIKDQAHSKKMKEYLNNIITLFDKIGLNEISERVNLDLVKYGLTKLE
jgi:hypothetical protein